MSTNLLENTTSGLEDEFSILRSLPKHVKSLTFGEYVKQALDAAGLTPYRAEKRSKEEAEKRGRIGSEFTISDATIGNIVNDEPVNLTMARLNALAWALGRPIEEVVGMAFGFYDRLSEFQKSEAFRMWNAAQTLSGSNAEYYAQRMSDLTREMESTRPKR